MSDYIIDLVNALQLVEGRYYYADAYDDIFMPAKFIEQGTENNFTSELRSEWRAIMKNNQSRYFGLNLDFDLSKNIVDKRLLPDVESVRPDLVLHQSQGDMFVNQKIYIEVKTNPRPHVKTDVMKILNAMSLLNYEFGVFISVNSTLQNVEELINHILLNIKRRYPDIIDNIDLGNFYFVHLNNPIERSLTVKTFENVQLN